jgi:hypothetical protein
VAVGQGGVDLRLVLGLVGLVVFDCFVAGAVFGHCGVRGKSSVLCGAAEVIEMEK